MNSRIFACCFIFLSSLLVRPARLVAQTVCDLGNGVLNPEQPSGITPAEIIQKFAAKDAVFKAEREHYGYRLDVNIRTLDRYGRIDGEYQQVSEITLDDNGKRTERTTFAPESTLRRVTLTEDDLDDIHEGAAFMLSTEMLPLFSINYVGRQHVDRLDTYVFDVAPANAKKEPMLFQGRLWVDDQDLMIVKTCGKPRHDKDASSSKKNRRTDLTPLFVTYREEIDGRFWFPTYSRADQFLSFPRDSVHIQEVIKYTNYKEFSPR